MRRTAVKAVLFAVGLAAIFGVAGRGGRSAASSESPPTSAVDPTSQRYASTAALALKVATGDDATEAAVFPASSRNAALAAINSGVIPGQGGDAEVVTVEFEGDFRLIGVSIPYGAEPPTAVQYFVILDSGTRQVLDAGGGPIVLDPSAQSGQPTVVAISRT